MREEWDMEFVDGGAKALERMAVSPFDVVVSDMRMPGMNGAELLNRVMKLYPKTVRLILSGHADRELILKCVGSTHQYLAKPCEPDAIKSTICGPQPAKTRCRTNHQAAGRADGPPAEHSFALQRNRRGVARSGGFLEIVGGIIARTSP